MRNIIWLLASFFAAGCASDGPAKADCTSPETLKMLTFCAGPPSADLAVFNAEAKKANNSKNESYNPVPLADSPTTGPEDAVVTIVMFTDLQCSFCARAHDDLKAILAANPDVRLVYKHYPLPFHTAAIPMGVAAMTAGQQGKFWEYVDAAYDGQENVSPSRLEEFARQVGIDTERFNEAFGTEEQLAIIQRDVDLGQQLGVTGTPTFFINGVRVEGSKSPEDFQATIDEQRTLVERLRDAGVDKQDLYWRTVALNFEAPAQEDIAKAPPEPPRPSIAGVPVDGVVSVPVDGAPVRGAKTEDALITVVMFSDFQCPYCERAEQTITELREKYPKARFVYRHFLMPFHPDAAGAAAASLVAQDAGKFWEFHDTLFANQDALTVDDLVAYGKELGLDEQKIRDAATGAQPERLIADTKLAAEIGVRGTPAFYINGINIVGAHSIKTFSALMDDQMTRATKLQAESNLTGEALYEAMVQANRAAVSAPPHPLQQWQRP